MNFNLTDEQSFIQETIRKFMRRECPHDLDERDAFPDEPWQKLARLGFCSLTVPISHF